MMTSPDPVVERVARAIHDEETGSPACWDRHSAEIHDYYCGLARAAVAAMGDTTPEPDSDDGQSLKDQQRIELTAEWLSGWQRAWNWDAPAHDGARDWWRSEAVDFLQELDAIAQSVPAPVAPQTQHSDEAREPTWPANFCGHTDAEGCTGHGDF